MVSMYYGVWFLFNSLLHFSITKFLFIYLFLTKPIDDLNFEAVLLQ